MTSHSKPKKYILQTKKGTVEITKEEFDKLTNKTRTVEHPQKEETIENFIITNRTPRRFERYKTIDDGINKGKFMIERSSIQQQNIVKNKIKSQRLINKENRELEKRKEEKNTTDFLITEEQPKKYERARLLTDGENKGKYLVRRSSIQQAKQRRELEKNLRPTQRRAKKSQKSGHHQHSPAEKYVVNAHLCCPIDPKNSSTTTIDGWDLAMANRKKYILILFS